MTEIRPPAHRQGTCAFYCRGLNVRHKYRVFTASCSACAAGTKLVSVFISNTHRLKVMLVAVAWSQPCCQTPIKPCLNHEDRSNDAEAADSAMHVMLVQYDHKEF